jgi:hypothetical protein
MNLTILCQKGQIGPGEVLHSNPNSSGRNGGVCKYFFSFSPHGGHEGGAVDDLIGLGAALVAGVGGRLHQRLHVRSPRHNPLHTRTGL